MSNYKFEEKIWITFEFNGEKCIGRTAIINGDLVVAIVSISAKVGHIPFELVQNPKKLTIKSDDSLEEKIDFLFVENREQFDLSCINGKTFKHKIILN